nr:Vacuolar-sorting receptor 1 [Ipomoea batatas]
MAAAGKTQLPTFQPARILSVGECASAPWLMVCSLREMVTSLASQVDLADVNSIMEVAGMKLKMDILTLRVCLLKRASALALQDSKAMVRVVKILMNAKTRRPASALNAAARIRGVVMTALAVMTCCISEITIPA